MNISSPSLPRFVAVDLDGTVLLEDQGISPRTLAAFELLRARGVTPLVATGRPRRSSLAWAVKLGVGAGLVCHNGAVVYSATAAILAETTIPEEAARRLVTIARSIPNHFHGFVGDEWLFEAVHPGTARYEHRSGFPGRQVDFDRIPRLGFHKAMFVATEEDAPGIAARLRIELEGEIEVYPSGSGFVEVVASGIGKGKSLSILVESLGGSMAEVLAFGDAWNDEDMLLRAGVGVAMGNAPAELRERVGRVALPIGQDGVAAWLEALFSSPS
ncbi:MAG: Cof-type HAD-IIB family hydrolase [Spirochaetota bacterium]